MSIEEDDSENLEEEIKYKLKLDAPKSEPAFGGSDDSGLDSLEDGGGFGGEEEGGFGGEEEGGFGGEEEGGKPFDDEPFEAGVEADEDEDPEKYVQQLAGKLGTSLRKYNDERGEPDFDLEKYAINSVISASHTSEMEEEDQKDIIRKVKTSGAESDVDDSAEGLGEPEPEEDGFGDEPSEEGGGEPEGFGGEPEGGFGGEEELEEGGEDIADSKFYVVEYKDDEDFGEGNYTIEIFDEKQLNVLIHNQYEILEKVEFSSRDAAERYMSMDDINGHNHDEGAMDIPDDEEFGHEDLFESKKNSKFVENKSMKKIIKGRLDEMNCNDLEVLGTAPAPAKPETIPVVKPGTPGRRKTIWETKPSVKPPAKMKVEEVDFDEIDLNEE